MGNIPTRVYHKSVRYRMHPIEVNAYLPSVPGINCTFGDYDFVNNEVTVHYACCDDPTLPPHQRRTMDDIDEEIARMEPRLVQDNKVPYIPGTKFHMEIKSILDLPAYDGQYDKLRSKAKDVYNFTIPKIELKDINAHYDKLGIKELKDRNVQMGTMTYG